VHEIAGRLPVAIASGAARAEIEAVLEASGLRPLFGVIVAAEDVGQGKPHPEGYLKALAQLGAGGGDALAFEDSDQGVISAVAAGMRCVAIAGTSTPERLRAAGAEAVVEALDWADPQVSGLFA
jgi:beta-phosphoglucomutase-like phosphatase (HAD superfamily)